MKSKFPAPEDAIYYQITTLSLPFLAIIVMCFDSSTVLAFFHTFSRPAKLNILRFKSLFPPQFTIFLLNESYYTRNAASKSIVMVDVSYSYLLNILPCVPKMLLKVFLSTDLLP